MIPSRPAEKRRILKLHGVESRVCEDWLVVEEPMEIRVSYLEDGKMKQKSLSVTMRTPGSDFELAAGFLFTEGLIRVPEEIQTIAFCRVNEKTTQEYNVVQVELSPLAKFEPQKFSRHFYISSSCGVCGKASLESLEICNPPSIPKDLPRINAEIFYALPDKLRAAQSVFQKTGGLHAAALFDTAGSLVSLKEDVGRHNALDKLIGEAFLAGKVPLHDSVLMVSGRTSFEIMQKSLMAGIPVVAAVGPPSTLAAELAERFGITLVGFLKKENFNVYASPDRVISSG